MGVEKVDAAGSTRLDKNSLTGVPLMAADSTALGDSLLQELERLPTAPPQVLKNGLRYSHKAMIDILIAQPWIRQNELARMFGRTPSWISTIMASDAFQSAFAARREEIVDDELKLSIEDQTRGLFARSLEVLKEKFDVPAANVSDQLALQTFTQTARALGYGARVDEKPAPNITNVVEIHAEGLVALLRREKLKIAQEPIDGQAESVGQSAHLLPGEAHRGDTAGGEASADK